MLSAMIIKIFYHKIFKCAYSGKFEEVRNISIVIKENVIGIVYTMGLSNI